MRQQVGGDAGAGVADDEANEIPHRREGNLELHATAAAVLERVVDQVLHDLLHLAAIGMEERQINGQAAAEDPAPGRLGEGAGEKRCDYVGE